MPAAALVGAGFQRHPGGGALDAVPALGCIAQGHDFGVGAACTLCVALAEYGAVGGGDDAAHARVGRGQPQGLLGQAQCQDHGWVRVWGGLVCRVR